MCQGLQSSRDFASFQSRTTSRLPETILLYLSITFSRLENCHLVIEVFECISELLVWLNASANTVFMKSTANLHCKRAGAIPFHRNKADST